jgi:hypothetical protein
MDINQIKYLENNYEELRKKAIQIKDSISVEDLQKNDLNETELFSYVNLLRFEKHIKSNMWINDNWDLYLSGTGAIMPLGAIQRAAPELWNGINITKENMQLTSMLDCGSNTMTWFESNLKHVRLSNNANCCFNLGIICALASYGLPFIYTKNFFKEPFSKIIKDKIDFRELNAMRFGAKFSSKRKDCFSHYGNKPMREEYDDEHDDLYNFTQIMRCIGIYCLRYAKVYRDYLNDNFSEKSYLIDHILYPLSFLVDWSTNAYYSNGELIKDIAYSGNLRGLTDISFRVIDSAPFNRIIDVIATHGKSYIEPVSDYVISIRSN